MTDREMISLIVENNDNDVRDALINKYRPLAMKAVKSVVGNSRISDYHDLHMQALLALDSGIYQYKFDSKAKFSTYIYTIMRNRVINEMRKQNAKKRKIGDYSTFESYVGNTTFTYDEIIAAEGIDPLDKYDTLLQSEFINMVLKEEESDLYHAYINGNSYKEIARSHDLSESKIRNKITYTKRKLKKNQEVYKKLIK